jgi:hypothetical protein
MSRLWVLLLLLVFEGQPTVTPLAGEAVPRAVVGASVPEWREVMRLASKTAAVEASPGRVCHLVLIFICPCPITAHALVMFDFSQSHLSSGIRYRIHFIDCVCPCARSVDMDP